jgi:hypothetical protein
VWAVDDPQVPSDRRTHEAYSQAVKKLVANPEQTYRRMYTDAVTLPWMGRVVVTMNVSAIALLPNIEADLLEKVIFLAAYEHRISFEGYKAKLVAELPHFAAYLKHFEIPSKLRDPKHRFGVVEFQHADLLAEAKADAPSADVSYIVDQWRDEYFRAVAGPEEKSWKGTAQQLHAELKGTASIEQALRPVARTPHHLGRLLSALSRQGPSWLRKTKLGGQQVYEIDRPAAVAGKPGSAGPKSRWKIEVPGTKRPEEPGNGVPGTEGSGADGTSKADKFLGSSPR